MQTHNFMATYQEGMVSQVDSKTHRIKVTIPALEDFETAWLPYLVPNAGGNQFYCLPDVGELVAVLLDARGEGGCVLGAIYNAQDPVPVQNADLWVKKFSNGTEIQHDRKTGNIVVNTTGTVTVTAAQAVVNAQSVINGNTTVNGNLHATGAITSDTSVSAPSVSSDNVELATHTHGGVESGGKRTGTPQ